LVGKANKKLLAVANFAIRVNKKKAGHSSAIQVNEKPEKPIDIRIPLMICRN